MCVGIIFTMDNQMLSIVNRPYREVYKACLDVSFPTYTFKFLLGCFVIRISLCFDIATCV